MNKILITERQLTIIKEEVSRSVNTYYARMVPFDKLEVAIGEDRRYFPMMAGDTNYSEPNIAKLMEDIKINGFKEPVILAYDENSGDCSIIEGNHRMEAARRLGLKEVPVQVERMTIRSDEQRAKNRMAPLNRLSLPKGLKPKYPSDLGFPDRPITDADYVVQPEQ